MFISNYINRNIYLHKSINTYYYKTIIILSWQKNLKIHSRCSNRQL